MFLGRTKIVRIFNGFGYGRREYITKRLVYDIKDLINQEKKIYILADPQLHKSWEDILKRHGINEYNLVSEQLQEVEENSILVIDILINFSGQFLKRFEKVYMMVNDDQYLKECQRKC